MQCSRAFTVEVTEIVVLFDWASPTLDPDGGTAAFAPDSTTGNEAEGSWSFPAASGPCTFDNTGSITWNSTASVLANMHIEVSSTGTPPDPTMTWGLSISVVAPFSLLLSENNGTLGFNSVTDVPFNLPDTGGADWTIQWNMVSAGTSNPNNAGSLTLIGEFTLA